MSGIFSFDESNQNVQVANDKQFKKLTKLFNQYYNIEQIYLDEDFKDEEEKQNEQKRIFKRKYEAMHGGGSAFKMLLMNDDNSGDN